MLLSCIHVGTDDGLLLSGQIVCHCVYEHIVSVYSSTNGQVGWLCISDTVRNASINNLVQFFEWGLQDQQQ